MHCSNITEKLHKSTNTKKNLHEAMRIFKEHESTCIELGNFDSLSDSLENQSATLVQQGGLKYAVDLLKALGHIFREYGFIKILSKALINLASISHTSEKQKEAFTLAYEAQEIGEKTEYARIIELSNKLT